VSSLLHVVSIVKALLLIGTYRNHAHRRERLRQAAAAATTPQRETGGTVTVKEGFGMCQYTVTVPIYDSLECASEWALGLLKETGLTSDSFFY